MIAVPESITHRNDTGLRYAHRLLFLFFLWSLATGIAVFFATLLKDSTIIGDVYIPRANDSFYHARRILDAAVGDTGLYQYETRIDPPNGIWIPWPWGYDYLMAWVVRIGMWLSPAASANAILAYIPVAWIAINAALFLGCAGALRLSLPMRSLAMLAFALSPLIQLLHGIAMIDHHFVELSFVLLNIWLGLMWMQRPTERKPAILLGAALGLAPAFHNGLFLLQLIPITTLLLLWLRGAAPSKASLAGFALALVLATLLAVLPSEPFRRGMFAFGYLSWFHLYVSLCTAAVAAFLAWRPFTRRQLAMLAGLATALAVPLLAQLALGAAFVSGESSFLRSVIEAQNLMRFTRWVGGPVGTAGEYSWLILLVPVLLPLAILTLAVDRRPDRVYFAAASALGLGLLLMQFRFYYFGLFPLIGGTLLGVELLRERFGWHRGMVFVVSLGLLAVAYQPALRQKLFSIYAIAADPPYQHAITIFFELGEVCKEDPGLVLANNDDGNAILYHSDCSVIANNMFVDAQDQARFDRQRDLMMHAGPDDLLAAEPPIKYLFVRRNNFEVNIDGEIRLDTGNRIISEILLSESPPEGFELLSSVYEQPAPDAELVPLARLYRLTPQAAAD